MDVYLDESGDIGLGPRSSSFFVIAALIISDPLEIQRCFKKIRKNRLKKKYRELPEFKFNNSDRVIKERVLRCLAGSGMEYWCSVLRKKELYNHLRDRPQIVYNFLAGSLISHMYSHYLPTGEFNVIVDKSLNGIQKELFDQFIVYKTLERNRPLPDGSITPTIVHVDSRRNACIQAADFVAGAIHRKYREEDDSCCRIIQENCVRVFDYFEGPQKWM